MTSIAPGPGSPARPVPDPGVITAGPADADTLSDLIAEAFLYLPPSRWLIGDPGARRAVFPFYFRIYVEHALATGIVYTTPGRTAALDHEGIPAYLEAATKRTRRLYARHGYRLRPGAPIQLPGDGPLMWPMWRESYQHLLKQPVLP